MVGIDTTVDTIRIVDNQDEFDFEFAAASDGKFVHTNEFGCASVGGRV